MKIPPAGLPNSPVSHLDNHAGMAPATGASATRSAFEQAADSVARSQPGVSNTLVVDHSKLSDPAQFSALLETTVADLIAQSPVASKLPQEAQQQLRQQLMEDPAIQAKVRAMWEGGSR